MYQYKTKGIKTPVEAFQITPERLIDDSDWPEWLRQAWKMEDHSVGSLQVEGGGTYQLQLETYSETKDVIWNDYIVKLPGGELMSVSGEAFESAYERIQTT